MAYKKMPPYVACSMFHVAKIHQTFFVAMIIANLTSIGVANSTYSRLWYQFPGTTLKLHKL
jgi:hypothetical protein